MPSKSKKQRNYIFYLRRKYKDKEHTPEDEKWIWEKDWEKLESGKLRPYKRVFFEEMVKYHSTVLDEDCFFIEKVIKPESYLNNLIKVFDSTIYQKLFGKNPNITEVIFYFSKVFSPFNIRFLYEASNIDSDGIVGMRCNMINGEIVIVFSISIQNYFNDKLKFYAMRETFKELLGHELIHRGQVIQDQNKKILIKKYRTDLKKNFLNKYEFMAYAWIVVEELRFCGADQKDLKKILCNREDLSQFSKIFSMFSNLENQYGKFKLNAFFKYMYEYAFA